MMFKKGDRVRTEDGEAGEILFVDRGGQEAQVALERISIKMRTDTLQKFVDDEKPAAAVTLTKARGRSIKESRTRRAKG